MRWAGHVVRIGEGRGAEVRNAYRIMVGKPELKISVGKQKRGWVDNIKIDLGEMG
jgi:hypothetical protein